MRYRYFLLLTGLLLAQGTSAQEWVVSPENGAKLSPFGFSDSTRLSGKNLFNLNCKSCHGEPGKNNAVKLVPVPPDPASLQMQKNSDGAIFTKVVEGRGPMPSFKNTLSASDVWKIVSFLRESNGQYVQEVAKKAAPGTVLEQVKFLLSASGNKKSIRVFVSSIREQKRMPVGGAEIRLLAARYFGNLPIGEAKATDSQGKVVFDFPADLPGDSTGNIRLLVKPADESAFGEARADTLLNVGLPTYRPPLNEPRAIWNVVQKTPVWLLITYLVSVLAVWGLIFYVLLLLRALYKLGAGQDEKN